MRALKNMGRPGYEVTDIILLMLTTESDSSLKVIFVKFSLAALGECLDGERRVSGEGAQTGEKIGGQVRASGPGLL